MAETDDEWVGVAADLPLGAMREVTVQGRSVALYRLEDGGWAATDNVCSHGRARLTDGWLDGIEVECPLHAGRFDILTGAALCAPASKPVAVHQVRVEEGRVFLRIG